MTWTASTIGPRESPALPSPETVRQLLANLADRGTPGLEIANLIDVGTGKFVSYLDAEILGDLLEHGGATCRFFEGPYGSGKTHLLTLIQRRAADRGMAVVRVNITTALPLEDWQQITRYILEHIELTIGDRTASSLPGILELLGSLRRADLDTFGRTPLPHGGFAEAMRLIVRGTSLTNEGRHALNSFLMGEKVTLSTFRLAGVTGVRSPLTARTSELILRTILNGLWALGVPGTVLLFDETERGFSTRTASAKQKTETAANLMRRFIDACTTSGLQGVFAVFAVLPGFVQSCALAYEALGQRLMTYDEDPTTSVPWRRPVLPVEAVSATTDRTDFLTGAADAFIGVAIHCGLRKEHAAGLRRELLSAGRGVLSRNAGSGYRRELVKSFAAITLTNLPS